MLPANKLDQASVVCYSITMEREIKLITDYLSMSSRLRGGRGLDAFVLRHGRAFPAVAKTDLPDGDPNLCFNNSFRVASSSSDYTYCEGYAVNSIGMPMHHAWLLDREGRVVEITPHWDDALAYFGIPFNRVYLVKSALDTGFASPLCTGDMFNAEIEDLEPYIFLERLHAPA